MSRMREAPMTEHIVPDVIFRREPVTLPETALAIDACRLMREHKVGAVVVLNDSGRLAGIFTGRDVVFRVVADERDPRSTRLADVMTRNPDKLSAEATPIEALRRMEDGGYRHLPVVDRAGQVVAVVSKWDFRARDLARLDEETGYWERI
jgi:CBS domain-containing protein